MEYFFSYGTLRDLDVQKKMFGRIPNQTDYTLFDYSVYSAPDGYFTVKEEEGSHIIGTLMQLYPHEMEILDLWEYVPKYIRIYPYDAAIDQKIVCYQRTDHSVYDRKVEDLSSVSDYPKEELMDIIEEFLFEFEDEIKRIHATKKDTVY